VQNCFFLQLFSTDSGQFNFVIFCGKNIGAKAAQKKVGEIDNRSNSSLRPHWFFFLSCKGVSLFLGFFHFLIGFIFVPAIYKSAKIFRIFLTLQIWLRRYAREALGISNVLGGADVMNARMTFQKKFFKNSYD